MDRWQTVNLEELLSMPVLMLRLVRYFEVLVFDSGFDFVILSAHYKFCWVNLLFMNNLEFIIMPCFEIFDMVRLIRTFLHEFDKCLQYTLRQSWYE